MVKEGDLGVEGKSKESRFNMYMYQLSMMNSCYLLQRCTNKTIFKNTIKGKEDVINGKGLGWEVILDYLGGPM